MIAQRREQGFGAVSVAARNDEGAMAELFGMDADFGERSDAEYYAGRGGEFKIHGKMETKEIEQKPTERTKEEDKARGIT